MSFRIEAGPVESLEAYARIPMRFKVFSRLDLEALRNGQFVEFPVTPREKDYDALESVATLPERFPIGTWLKIEAFSDGAEREKVGGAILALKQGSEMMEGRGDLAILWDIRVHPSHQEKGVGRLLFETACNEARKVGAIELRVETQDINVRACHFYLAMGCKLHSIEEHAYGDLDEAKLLFSITL